MDDDSYRFYVSVHTLYILLGRSFDANVSHHGIGVSRGQYMILYLLSKTDKCRSAGSPSFAICKSQP